MKAYDFEFDNKKLSSYNFMICNFGSKGLDTISNGSNVTFNTVSTLGGAKHELISAEYEDCLETTIQVCKNYCHSDVEEISSTEFRELTKWLSRKKFLKFKILSEEYIDLYFEVKIDISRIEIDGRLIGLELNITTNRPFALKEPRTIIVNPKKIYNWDKYGVLGEITKQFISDYITIHTEQEDAMGYIAFSKKIEYADEIKVDTNGFISLVDSKSIKYYNDDFENLIKEKYIHIQDSTEYYWIPSTTIFEISNRLFNVNIKIKNMYELTGLVSRTNFIKSVISENNDTYPMDDVQDGYYYIYTGETFNCTVNDTSHEEGYIYPHTEITVHEDGNLKIYNAIEDRNTYIANCVAGEIITMDYPIIQSSISSHNIQNDFNWNFFRVANTYENSRNDLVASIPCTIKIKYSPIVKVGL